MKNKDIVENLAGVFYLATAEDDQPHVRPFDKAAEVEGKIYIGTTNAKKVFSQILNNPKVEIFAMNDFGICRFSAEAFPEEDAKLSEEAFEKMEKPFNPETSAAIRLEKIQKA